MKLKEKTKKDARIGTDLTDSPADRQKLRPDTATIDLPDVEDIPGQEFIQPPTVESFVDDTISSADEEGPVSKKKKNDEDKDDAASIMADEDLGLNDSADSEDFPLRQAALDDTDDDGDPLNEDEDFDGNDLDVPGAADDDDEEETGGEDEENNLYSDDNDREDSEGRE